MINKRQVEALIPKAIELIKVKFDTENKKGVPKELNGYISSFGAAIIQSGLIPAVAFYERAETNNGKEDTASNRKILMKIIAKLIGYELNEKELLLEKLIENNKAKKRKKEIINASIAVKLALRVYNQLDENTEKENKSGDNNE